MMEELEKQAKEIETKLRKVLVQLKIAQKERELAKLQEQSQKPGFWADPATAKKLAKLQNQLEPWRKMQTDLKNVWEILKLSDANEMRADLQDQLTSINKNLEAQKALLKFSGPFDDHDAILSLYAGAGGTDA